MNACIQKQQERLLAMPKCLPDCTCGRHSSSGKSYATLHSDVVKARGKAKDHQCDSCGEQAHDWATIHDTDGTDPFLHYKPLCRECHHQYDGHGEYMHIGRKRSEESKRKMSSSAKARCTPEWRKAQSERMKQRWEDGKYG
jgi:hypothetical protein